MEVIVIHPYRKILSIEEELTLAQLLGRLGIDYNDVLVLCNERLIINDQEYMLSKDDNVRILPMIAGG